MLEQSGEMSIAYFKKEEVGKRTRLAIVEPRDAWKLIASGWQEITAKDYADIPSGECKKLDLRRKVS